MNGKWFAATLVLVGVSSFLAGRQTGSLRDDAVLRELEQVRSRLDTLATRDPVTARPDPATAPTVDTTRLSAELAQVLREELARASVTARPAPTPAPAPAEPTPQATRAHQQARQLLDDAVRARRWTTEDALAFRRALVDMTPTQRDEVIRRLVTSINSQSLDVQTQGAPF
ncbi:hypothetical protein LY474_12825 [Myxococcus stipitatus]|uniref:hypothetical protein n=1 Tax=Myxococcus stipitatus TaxID=83455 RepID=UPI001F1E08D7|nr:hypothetical protein [Myxococcus stipitatus]MCE9668700.1 hypothetical protein [Myxococcus stipitatus]